MGAGTDSGFASTWSSPKALAAAIAAQNIDVPGAMLEVTARVATVDNVAAGVAAGAPGVTSSFVTKLAIFLPLDFLAGAFGANRNVDPTEVQDRLAARSYRLS